MDDQSAPRVKFFVEHSNFLSPEDLYRFIHLDGFEADWEQLGLDDDELSLLQIQIMVDPLQPAIIDGTGGIRGTRFNPPPREGEKPKAIEVLYAAFPDFSVAVLAAADIHGETEILQPDDRESLRMIMAEIEDALARGE